MQAFFCILLKERRRKKGCFGEIKKSQRSSKASQSYLESLARSPEARVSSYLFPFFDNSLEILEKSRTGNIFRNETLINPKG